jgi:hypothetical protein
VITPNNNISVPNNNQSNPNNLHRADLTTMASPHTSSPYGNTATSSTGEYFMSISQLMAEKDCLITGKDELVVSKDRLWRELHQIIQEKSELMGNTLHRGKATNNSNWDHLEFQRLREENEVLKRRNRELEQALRDALEVDEDFKDELFRDDSRALPAAKIHGRVQK